MLKRKFYDKFWLAMLALFTAASLAIVKYACAIYLYRSLLHLGKGKQK